MKKLIGIIAALAMITTYANAAEWNFYGSARIQTWIVDTEKGNDDSTSYVENLQGNSRIGAKVKVSDELSGGFEYSTGVSIRKLYGEWDFGVGKLLVGQTYTPIDYLYSNQVYDGDTNLLYYGGVYSSRKPMVQFRFNGFKLAFIEPQADKSVDASKNGTKIIGLDGTNTVNTETDFPYIEASYTFKTDMFSIKVAGGYNSYELSGGNLNKAEDVDSWAVALGGKVNMGPAYAAANVFMGENAGHILTIDVDGDNEANDGYVGIDGGELVDNEVVGFMVLVGYTLNDMVAFEAGYGWVETEYDKPVGTDNIEDDAAAAYYLQATLTLAPGVFIVPEVGMLDGDEEGDTETLYYGAKWQINF